MAETKLLLAVILLFCKSTLSQEVPNSTAPKPTTGFSLKLIHKDSPLSPFYNESLTYHDRVRAYVQSSMARGAYWGNTNSTSNTMTTQQQKIIAPIRGVDEDYYFMVLMGIGTPGQDTYLKFDTGGTLSWTQCATCTTCFPQAADKYDPKLSSTYHNIPCYDPRCDRGKGYRCIGTECIYKLSYVGGRRSKGVASLDSFSFLNKERIPESIGYVWFGCGIETNFGFETKHLVSGILGMSRDSQSLPSQLNNQIGERFSHCFINIIEPPSTTSYLRFGTDIPEREDFQKIQIVDHPKYEQAWALNLVDISIAHDRMNFPAGTFAVKPDGSGGCIIDSGAPFTVINPFAYAKIRNTFEFLFKAEGLEKVPDPFNQGFDICYQLHTMDVLRPLTFHFEGANLEVITQSLYLLDEKGAFCVAMSAGKPEWPNLIGVLHQQDIRFVYDLNQNELLFAPEFCQDDIS